MVQLQAADYLAYEIRKFIVDHPKIKAGEREFRKSLGALPGNSVRREFISQHRLISLCEKFRFKKRS